MKEITKYKLRYEWFANEWVDRYMYVFKYRDEMWMFS